jgi:hypothetical protein
MKWNIAIVVLVGFVLAMAFGGRMTSGPLVSPPPLQTSN